MKRLFTLISLLFLLSTVFSHASEHKDSLRYFGDVTLSFAGGANTPFWFTNNTQGLGSVKKNNGRLRLGLFHDLNRQNRWSWGAGIDLYTGFRQQSPFFIHQAYGEIRYRCLDLMIGAKELNGVDTDPRLSSGNLLYSGNSAPIPQIRAGIFDFADIWGLGGWLGIKGYLAFGLMTDSKWIDSWTKSLPKATNVLYHSKGLWLRNGNPSKFPLTLDVGIEMATQFGGHSEYTDIEGYHNIKNPSGWRAFWKALVPLGGSADTPSGDRTNIQGNFLGNWSFALTWHRKSADWYVKAYYQHMFEDHSMLYIQYPWRDGLWGVEGKLPSNRFVSKIVYEFLYTKDQTGPVYWDHTPVIDNQVSGVDQYYYNFLYGAWQHWGQIIGNPLIVSPIYNDGNIMAKSTRLIAHHLGFEGQPLDQLSYRVLLSHSSNWGTYFYPLPEVEHNFNLLLEASWKPEKLMGWETTLSFGLDHGNLIGNSAGAQISISKTGFIGFR